MSPPVHRKTDDPEKDHSDERHYCAVCNTRLVDMRNFQNRSVILQLTTLVTLIGACFAAGIAWNKWEEKQTSYITKRDIVSLHRAAIRYFPEAAAINPEREIDEGRLAQSQATGGLH